MVDCLPSMPKALGSIPSTEKEKPKPEKLLFPRAPNFIDCAGHFFLDSMVCAAWWAENPKFVFKDWGGGGSAHSGGGFQGEFLLGCPLKLRSGI